MARIVERNGTRIWIIDDATGREMWNGRTDSIPPQDIRYSEGGTTRILNVARSTDTELLQALGHLLNPT
jgi:hypothetical protein